MPASTRTIWKRRLVLMAVVGLLIAIPVTIAVRGGDDGDTPSASPGPEAPALGRVQSDRKLGLELRVPRGWKERKRGGVATYRSSGGDVLVAISAPGPKDDAKRIHAQAITAISTQYRKVKIRGRSKNQKLGGRPASTAALSALHPRKRTPLRILVSTARGEKRAYLVEVFAAGRRPTRSLLEAQALLGELTITG